MFHTLQNVPTVYEGKKSTEKKLWEGWVGGGGVNNNKHNKSQWARGQKNQWGHSEAVSAIPTTQILQPLFLSLLLFFFCISHFYKVLANEWRERGGDARRFPRREGVLAWRLDAADDSAAAQHCHLAAKLRPNVASCCLNKTHWFSTAGKKLLSIHHDGQISVSLFFRTHSRSCV